MTAPALAVDGGRLGRLYRRPGAPPPDGARIDAAGRLGLSTVLAQREVDAGRLVPSITNVIGVRDKPQLLPWVGKVVASEAVRLAGQWPEQIAARPADAVTFLRGAADRERDAAAARGDLVHQACEKVARGEPCPPVDAEARPYLDAWQAWLDRWQPEFLYVEATVFGDAGGLGYAGTADFIARVGGVTVCGDYKTGRTLHDDVALQLSAVAHASQIVEDGDVLGQMPVCEAGIAVHLNPVGYQTVPVVLDGQVWETFTALRSAWDFHASGGRLRTGEPALGRVLAGPEHLQAATRLPRVA